MKRALLLLLSGWMLASLTLCGCGRHKVSTSALEDNFQSAEPAAQDLANHAIAAIKAGNYPEALDNLQKLANKAKMNPDQRQAILDTLAAVQYQMTNTANEATAKTSRSFTDWLKSLLHR
jgi:outer membrane protein assembly factor BamD (BamD/ComL family)